MPPRDAVALEDMLAHAREAAALIQGKSRADLDHDRVLSLALVRLLEIVGEAAARVSAEERAKHPTIPWAEIVSLRNRLIHGYASVDMDIVWEILRRDVPALIAELQRIVSRQA
jgi:uncharacterized protein with HEPN domain